MMDTVLNLGLNDTTVEGLAAKTKNPRFAYDSCRRFIHMVLERRPRYRAQALSRPDRQEKVGGRREDRSGPHRRSSEGAHLRIQGPREKGDGKTFPRGSEGTALGAIGAVFRSWNGNRAVVYRRLEGIPDHWGTAVNVQAMVFGNMGNQSATGVAFTRDPATGEKRFFGEFLPNRARRRRGRGDPHAAPRQYEKNNPLSGQSLESTMPEIYKELESIYKKLENHFRDMQDIEFTIQEGRLWMLQTRSGKRTGRSAIKIAVDMVEEGMIDDKTALKRVDPVQLDSLLHPMIDPTVKAKPIAKGLPHRRGRRAAESFFPSRKRWSGYRRRESRLVRLETSPEDVEGMKAAEAIVTARGGMTSHAAVVARGWGSAASSDARRCRWTRIAGCSRSEARRTARETP